MADINYAPMFQGEICRWGDYHLYGDVYYGPIGNPQITHKDSDVLHDGHASIRIDGPRTVFNGAREVNEYFYAVKPGDHIILRCWIKADPCTTTGYGGLIGFDFYGNHGRIGECHPRTIQSEIWRVNEKGFPIDGWNLEGEILSVPYGSDWTLLTLDVIIPATYYNGSWENFPGVTQITHIGLWIGASWNDDESASVWFADSEFYINPETPEPPTTITPQTTFTCPYGDGYKFDSYRALYQHVLAEHTDELSKATLAARVPMLGNSVIVQLYLRRLRDKLFSRKTHKKLHPWI